MSIKKEAASKQWLEIHDKVLDGLDDNISPRLLWDNQDVNEVVELAGITTKQAEIWLTKGEPAPHYTVEDQTEALVLFKALLVYNALIEEAKMTRAKDLVDILNSLKEAIIKLERREDAFKSLGEMFFSTLNGQKQKLIRAKLRTVRGNLNTTPEITIASVVAVLFCDLATSTDIREVGDVLETKLKAPFKSLVKAKGNLTSLAGCSITGTHARLLKTAIKKALEDYSPNTGKVANSADTKILADELNKIKDNTALTDSEKMIQQQKVIDASDLEAPLKEVVRILSDADVIIRGGDLQTDVAVELGLTKDQEDAMLGSDTGMTLISAGAGSGKTRVLSGKVAHLLSQDEVTPYNIMAVSFSRKSAQDLAEKVKDAVGSRIPQMSHTAIGRTTHSIAQEIVNRFHPEAGDATLVSDDFELDRLIKRAITLVKETAPDSSKVKSTSLFADQIDSIQRNQKRNDLSVLNLLIAVEKYRRDKGFLKAEEAGIVESLFSIRESLLNDEDLTATEIDLVNRELDTERGDKVLNRAFGGNPGKYKFYQQKKTASVDAPMWWGSKVEGQEEVKINPKEAQLFITKCKANMVSPTEAYNKVNRPDIDESFILKAKVYGAYAHILTTEGLSDFDDMLIEAVKVLSRKTNLKQLQKQYKHIIVDEAQDLNPVQHAFFGLLSGTMEAGGKGGEKPPVPVEAPVMDSGRSITFIGDENQSIYGFRGAQSSEFSSKATQNDGAFDVMTLGVNFRSTKAIVDAANKLISEEEGSLGMVCTAVFQEQDNGSDSITKDADHQSPYDAAGAFADRVKRGTSEGDIYKASDYGVACRTNAELVPYALSLLDKDINFTCPVNPFKHPTTKKILRALGIGSTTIGASDFIGSFFGAFLNLHRDLGFDLGRDVQRVFKSHLQNPKKFEELEAQFKRLTDEQLDPFFLADLEDVNKTNARELVIVGSCLEVCENSDGLFSASQVQETNNYCSLVDDLLVARHDDPSSLFDLIVGNKTFEDGGKFEGPKGTLKDMIVGMSKTHADEMAQALTTITSEEEIQELKDVDFALAPLVALRSIFLKAVKEGGLDRVFEKFRNLEISSQVAMKQSKDQGVEAVTLDTIHGWKGLEVTHLTVPMVAGKFPSDKEDFDPIVHATRDQAKIRKAEQERMLAYVAVTRGKKSVTVQSYELTGGGKDAGESEFISLIFGDCKKEASLKTARQILAETVEVRNDSLSDREIDLAIKMFG